MSSSTSEEKKNPVVTLKAKAEKFDYRALRARATTEEEDINRGGVTFRDLPRMNFIINKKDIDQNFINQLYAKHASLIENNENGEKNYRPFAKQVFIELFEYAEAQVPSDPILEELVTNCNQAGYEGALTTDIFCPAFAQSKLSLLALTQKTVNISCKSQNCVELRSHMEVPVMDQGLVSSVKNDNHKEAIICNLQGSLEFTLESQDGKDGVTYKNGKLSLTVPRKLRDYKASDKNLFDILKEYFYRFCEKLGFKFEVEIEHDLDDQLEVNSSVKDPDVDPLSNKRGVNS
ncbi:hypothetical protein [Wolbachia pipientis]|uniref:hypothetical protein n=1 Tax=Wolbachia pipientis TaxID=955 RepID=UPI0020302060|nr:hypothetical protein [Wolbachia pipientis]MCM1002268.1 hypothetical protein [Wolbachia pipientis]